MMRPRPGIDVHLHLHDAAPAFMQSATRQRFNVLASIDPRAWLPGRASKVGVRFAVPDGTPAGACEMLFALPDGAGSLAGGIRYSVRPANADEPPGIRDGMTRWARSVLE